MMPRPARVVAAATDDATLVSAAALANVTVMRGEDYGGEMADLIDRHHHQPANLI